MRFEARDFVAKRLSPAHIAVIVFVVTSLLLQTASAFGEQSQPRPANSNSSPDAKSAIALAQWVPSIPKNFRDALAHARWIAENHSENVQAVREAQENVLKMAETIARKLTEGQTRVANDGEITKEQKDNVIRHLERIRTWMRTELDLARIPIDGVILINPNIGPTASNLHQIRATWAATQKSKLRSQIDSVVKGAPGAAKHFGMQYATFGAASFLLAVIQLGYAYESNPVAVEQNLRGISDLTGAAGFAVFMGANHHVAKLMHGIQNRTIPPSMIPMTAMLAGGVASTMFHDVIQDQDLWKCSKSYYLNFKRDDVACNRAIDNWVVTNKIAAWTPGLVSLLASQALADVARAGIVVTGKGAVAGLDGMASRLTVRGLVLVPKGAKIAANALRSFGTAMVTGNPIAVITVGGVQFLAFLYIDSVISEPIRYRYNDQMMARLNLKTWFQKYGFHRDFYDPPTGAKQMIQNAFDVEGTDLRSANKYLRLNYINLARNGWQQPDGPNKCVPPEIAERNIPGILMTKPWFIANGFDNLTSLIRVAYRKSDDQLRCEVLAQPKELIGRYAEQNEAWRTEHLLKSFKDKQTNWYQLITQFNDEYQAAYKLTKLLADAKFAESQDSSKKPDLSKEALVNSFMEESLQGIMPVEELKEKAQPTPEMERAIRALACGSRQNLFMRGISKVTDWWNSGPTSAYIPTKFGSSWTFHAPNITTGDGSICRSGQWTMDPNYTPISNETQLQEADTFTGKFYDRASGKTYTGLAEYIYDNLSEDVWKSEGRYSNFALFWNGRIQGEVEKVWATYTETYKKLVTKDFVPVAFNREFRNGCPTSTPEAGSKNDLHDEDGFVKQTTAKANDPDSIRLCPDNHMSLRVAHGVFLSVEIELRNYLRGLHAMNAALYKDQSELAASQARIVKPANELVNAIATLNPQDLREMDIEALNELLRAKLDDIKTQIETRLEELNEPKEKSFRREMLNHLVSLSGGLIMEISNMASEVKMMDFADANARQPNKDIYKKKGGNPFNRGAQH